MDIYNHLSATKIWVLGYIAIQYTCGWVRIMLIVFISSTLRCHLAEQMIGNSLDPL